MSERVNFSSGAIWEDIVGYSRAVRIGNLIEVSGTTSVNDDEIIGEGDPYKQTTEVINKIKHVLESAGSSLKDVIRVRIYVVNIKDWEKIGNAFSKYFKSIKPAATLIEVNSLIKPGLLVEIEASAVIQDKA